MSILMVTCTTGIFLVMSTSAFADSPSPHPQERIEQRENRNQKSLDKPLSQEQHHAERMQKKSTDNNDLHLGKPLPPPGQHAHQPGVLLHTPPGADE